MHKSWIAGAAVLASLALFMAVLFVTRTPAPPERSSTEAAHPVATAAGVAAEPGGDNSKLSVPEAAADQEKGRAAATAARKPPPVDRRAGPALTPDAALAHGALRFCGRVEEPGGAPSAEARIALFSSISGEPSRMPLAYGRADARGAFCIDAHEPNELILLVCADGFEPFTRVLPKPAQALSDLGALRLTSGASIAGRASSDGRPLPRAEIAAVLDSPLETYTIENGFLKWVQGRFAWSFAISDSHEDGTYRISGLGSDVYKVRISSLRGRQSVLGFQSSANRDVRAPAEGVDFALDAATQRVTFRYNASPMRGVEAQLESGGIHLTALSDADGTCTFKVTPHLDATLIGSLSGYKVVRLPLTAPGAGEERSQVIDLELFHPPASVVFDLVPPGSARVQRARFLFYGADATDGKSSFVKEVDLKSPERTRAPRNIGSREEFEAAGIPPGFYRIVVQAGDLLGYASTPQGNSPYCEYCDAEVELSVPATGIVHQRVSLVPRSTLQIAARDRTGHGLPARAKLFDTRGAPIEMSLAAKRNGIWQSLTALDENDPTTVRSTLCSGPADIELSCPGFHTKRVKVSFDGQSALPIEVTLDPE